MINARRVWIGTFVLLLLVLLFPQKIVFVPEMNISVRYEGGDVVPHADVSRSWNHYLDSGWKANLMRADENGKVTLKESTGRVPLLLIAMKYVGSIPGHYYPGMAGSIKARDSENHNIYSRVDFRGNSCCPAEIVIGTNEKALETQYLTFGEIVPNE